MRRLVGWTRVLAVLLVVVAGIGSVSSAVRAEADAGDAEGLRATVGSALFIGSHCTAAPPSFPPLATGDDDIDSSECVISFGTEAGDTGAMLQVRDTDRTEPFLCRPAEYPRCDPLQYAGVPGAVNDLPDGTAGVRLKGSGRPAQPAWQWPSGAAGPVGAAFRSPVCYTTGSGVGTCTVAFTADPSPAQPVDVSYAGSALFQVIAN